MGLKIYNGKENGNYYSILGLYGSWGTGGSSFIDGAYEVITLLTTAKSKILSLRCPAYPVPFITYWCVRGRGGIDLSGCVE